ncbi:hypothetical protein Mapa_005185 [Marchantia paleacea]|nr:hypothetical protein Mapa_005185 [Marchantia paleacea]
MGIPINQEDLLGTLCEFSIVVITNLRKMGIHPTPNEVTAYLHLWHVIGYYLGVTGELSNHMVSEEGATALFDSIENHLVDPNEGSAKTAHVLLHSLASDHPCSGPTA